jgi:hypothetical protein
MKRFAAVLGVILLAGGPVAAQGQGAAPDSVTITGQVVDVSCYTLNGASGAGHKQCAQACADKGIVLGILVDGTIYIPLGAGMANAQNARFREFAEGRVRVTGMHRFTNGVHTIEVRSVSAAS